MAHPKPLNNPEYTRIIFAIMNNKRTPKLIRKVMSDGWQKPSNLSMKFQQLLISGILSKMENRYYINAEGMLRYVSEEILGSDCKSIRKIVISKGVHRLLFCYLTRISEKDIKEILSIHDLLLRFVIGVGYNIQRKSSSLKSETISNQYRELLKIKGIKNIESDLEGDDFLGYEYFKAECRGKFVSSCLDQYTWLATKTFEFCEDGTIDFQKLGM